MSNPIRVIQYGLGPIGIESARTVLKKEATGQVKLVGAIDIDPEKIGRDVAELLDLEGKTGIVVSDDAEKVIADANVDVALHTTTSFLDSMHEQLEKCARAGVHVVSSTEELAYPYKRYPELSDKLDDIAKEHGVVLHGTGVNPGFAMDTLALTATGVCNDVERIHIERVVDAGRRRLPLQQKVGAGISKKQFEEKKATGTFGHIGLRESLYLVASGLGWEISRVDETLEALIAEEDVTTRFLKVSAGEVAGIHHRITGDVEGKTVLTLNLKMYVGAPEQYDAVEVVGDPPIDLVVRDGIFGDTATVAALVNAIPRVINARAGLLTTKDLPVPRAFATVPRGETAAEHVGA